MNRSEDLAWAAGIFEGEGCFTVIPLARGTRPTPRAQLQMSDEDVVREFHRVVVVGRRRTQLLPPHKTQYVWYTTSIADFIESALLLAPYMKTRRYGRLLEVWETIPTPTLRFGNGGKRGTKWAWIENTASCIKCDTQCGARSRGMCQKCYMHWYHSEVDRV